MKRLNYYIRLFIILAGVGFISSQRAYCQMEMEDGRICLMCDDPVDIIGNDGTDIVPYTPPLETVPQGELQSPPSGGSDDGSNEDEENMHNGGEDPDNNVSDNNQEKKKDCAGVVNGQAYYDDCQECVGGTTGKKPCDPNEKCMDELLDAGAHDGMSCMPRKSVQELQAAFPCATNFEDLQRVYEEGFQAGIQCMFPNEGAAEVQGKNEMRCGPLSIQYVGCATQQQVMSYYMYEIEEKNVNPCDYTNGNKDFPGITSENDTKLVIEHYIDSDAKEYLLNSEAAFEQFYNDIEAGEKYVVQTRGMDNHVFVITGKGPSSSFKWHFLDPRLIESNLKGYDPSEGENVIFGYRYFFHANIILHKVNGCK